MRIVIEVDKERRGGRNGVRIKYSCTGLVSGLEKAKVLQICDALDAVIKSNPNTVPLHFSQSCTRVGNG